MSGSMLRCFNLIQSEIEICSAEFDSLEDFEENADWDTIEDIFLAIYFGFNESELSLDTKEVIMTCVFTIYSDRLAVANNETVNLATIEYRLADAFAYIWVEMLEDDTRGKYGNYTDVDPGIDRNDY